MCEGPCRLVVTLVAWAMVELVRASACRRARAGRGDEPEVVRPIPPTAYHGYVGSRETREAGPERRSMTCASRGRRLWRCG